MPAWQAGRKNLVYVEESAGRQPVKDNPADPLRNAPIDVKIINRIEDYPVNAPSLKHDDCAWYK
jgi:hypothetical protein